MSNSENFPASGQPRRYTSRKAISAGVLTVALLVAITISQTYERFWPVRSLDGLHLGMSEVDVTLALGEKPEAINSSVYSSRRELVFSGGLKLQFATSGMSSVLYQICSSGPPYELKIYNNTTESDILSRFGEPSFVSVSNDGTTKISSFKNSNLAFEFRKNEILKACVSNKMPVRYVDEYGNAFRLQLPEPASNGGA